MLFTREMNMAAEKMNLGHKFENKGRAWQFAEERFLPLAEENSGIGSEGSLSIPRTKGSAQSWQPGTANSSSKRQLEAKRSSKDRCWRAPVDKKNAELSPKM